MLVIHLTSSLRRGGRERQLVTLCKYSESEKLNTRIVCFNRTKESYEEEYGLENSIIYLNSKSFKDRFIELARIIRREKADIIWSWGGLEATMGLLLSLTTKARHINGSVRHGIVLMKPDHIWRMLILHLSKNIVANSKAGLRANHLCRGTVMYNGLDESFFIDNGTQQNIIKTLIPSYQESDMIFISVANLVPYKDYFTVILALEELRKTYKNFKYLIVGEGPKRSIIEQQIKGKGLENNIYLLGLRQNIKELLACADIFIHSSKGEGCSNAILEAMAAGLPVIATDTGGTREIVNDRGGFLFRYGNASQLTQCLSDLIARKNEIPYLKNTNRKYAESHFSAKIMTNHYYSILDKVAR